MGATQTLAFGRMTLLAHSRGRVRLAVPALYQAPALQPAVVAALACQPRVLSVQASALTGHVLLLFDPALPLAQLLEGLGGAAAAQTGATPEAGGGQGAARFAGLAGIVESVGAAFRALRQPQAAPATSGGTKVDVVHDAHEAAPERAAPGALATDSPWHLQEAGAVLAAFGSAAAGLSEAEAQARLRHGANVLATAPPPSALALLLRQFGSLPGLLLAASALLSVVTGGTFEAAAIVAVLLLNGGIGFVTEWRAETTLATLAGLAGAQARVRRAGRERLVDAACLVPGDIVLLTPGMPVMADLRLLEVGGLSIDEAPLTGESVPVAKRSATLAGPAPLAERGNMAYRGTAVLAGSGTGLVVATGKATEMGAVEALMRQTARPPTPIERQLDQLGGQLLGAGVGLCLAIFGLGLARGYPALRMARTALSLAVAAVPEGLPAVATSALTRGLGVMRRHHVLMRRLQAVETIGAIQTICLDKTGTLTENRMSAVAVHSVRRKFDPARPRAAGAGAQELQRLLQVCVLCNQSEWDGGQPDPSEGSGTENALLELAARAGVAAAPLRQRYRLLATELRAPGRNYMRTVHACDGKPGRLVAVKGSPAEVLALCRHYLDGAQTRPLDAAARARILRQNQAMAQRQWRVLGFAFGDSAGAGVATPVSLCWIGLVGLADPLRPEMARMIARFHAAGIRTVMLTGDQAVTAGRIGQALQLNGSGPLRVLNADQLDRLTPQRLHALAREVQVFARVSPAHKLQIVRALQFDGQVVAMTGDGVNDGPALRAADIGIAMGGGSELALSAADAALEDDRLDTLLEAVRQGRTIAGNIGKALHFLLSSNFSEILLVLGTVALGQGPPLSPLQLLWLNLLTDLAPALALAVEPAQDDVMRQAPRAARHALLGPAELRRYGLEATALAGAALAAYVYGMLGKDAGARAPTLAFNALVYGQLGHAWWCRRDPLTGALPAQPNHALNWAIGGSMGLQALTNLLPGLRRGLGLAPLGLADMAVVLAAAGLPRLFGRPGGA